MGVVECGGRERLGLYYRWNIIMGAVPGRAGTSGNTISSRTIGHARVSLPTRPDPIHITCLKPDRS